MKRGMMMVGLLVAVLAGGCASVSEKARFEVFEATARAYARALRWSEYENAYGFVKASDKEKAPDFERLKNIRVTNVQDVGVKLRPDGKTVEQIIRVQYVRLNRMAERTITVVQIWEYDFNAKRWFMLKGFPTFP